MNYLKVNKKNFSVQGQILIGGSKSESNRLLILHALFPKKIFIENLSESDDTEVLKKSLNSRSAILDVHHAGTAMRFLTAYCAIQKNKVFILQGSQRMHERPIAVLVHALRELGARIDYLGQEGYPPLKIYGQKITGGPLSIASNMSSQYISALILVGTLFEKGLQIHLSKKITSAPYISMTLQLLRQSGIIAIWQDRDISIVPVTESSFPKTKFFVESDWTSASYYYSLASLSKESDLYLSAYKKNSLQGDCVLADIYHSYFGIRTFFTKGGIHLTKDPLHILPTYFEYDLNNCPDIAQTIAVNCAGLKIKCLLKGLETLKIKETDRLGAMQNELRKIGAQTYITDNSLEIVKFNEINSLPIPIIHTYHDHRMALAFAPLALHYPLIIENPEVVQKSYPTFWQDLTKLGFELQHYTEY